MLNVKIFSTRVSQFVTKLVDETIRTREEKNIVRPDMIHLMMEARKGKHEYDLVDEDDNDGAFASLKNSSPNCKYFCFICFNSLIYYEYHETSIFIF